MRNGEKPKQRKDSPTSVYKDRHIPGLLPDNKEPSHVQLARDREGPARMRKC